MQSVKDSANTIKRINGTHLKPYNSTIPPVKSDVSLVTTSRQSFQSSVVSPSISSMECSSLKSSLEENFTVEHNCSSVDQVHTQSELLPNSCFLDDPVNYASGSSIKSQSLVKFYSPATPVAHQKLPKLHETPLVVHQTPLTVDQKPLSPPQTPLIIQQTPLKIQQTPPVNSSNPSWMMCSNDVSYSI